MVHNFYEKFSRVVGEKTHEEVSVARQVHQINGKIHYVLEYDQLLFPWSVCAARFKRLKTKMLSLDRNIDKAYIWQIDQTVYVKLFNEVNVFGF